MPQDLPEYITILQARYPNFTNDAIIIASIGMEINGHAGADKHAETIINQCRVAWEIFNSVHCLIAYDYGLGALTLCRNLFELVAGTMFLVDNPHKLADFIDYGKMVAYELAESMGADQKYLEAFRTKADYPNLRKRFGRDKWHGKSVKALAEAVGMQGLYRSFYKEASAVAHGDSYVTLGYKGGEWKFSKDVRNWSNYCEIALTFSYLLMATLYHKAVHSLKLPFVADVQTVMGHLMNRGLVRL